MGRRVSKSLSEFNGTDWTQTSKTLYVYDGWNLIQELNGTGAVQKSYVWGLDLSQNLEGAGGVGGLLSMTNGTSTYLYCYDGNGNVGQMVDTSGSLVANYQYDPFGKTIASSGFMKDDNPFQFSTKYHDTETGLSEYGLRLYSPELGRWLTIDPAKERGGFNLYVFVSNNPVTYSDYLGLWKRETETGHIWIAQKGDSLSSLAMDHYDAKSEDHACLWPTSDTKDHGYPDTIRPCDKYDASNLADPSPGASSIDIAMSSIFDNPSWLMFPYYATANEAYEAIKNTSSEGGTPIKRLRVFGHCGPSVPYITRCRTCEESHFQRSGLVSYAAYAEPPLKFSRARAKKGPLRCWFARNVRVWGAACNSGKTFAPDFAKIIREGGFVSGLNNTLGTRIDLTIRFSGAFPTFSPGEAHIGNGPYHSSWESFINDPNWIHKSGSL